MAIGQIKEKGAIKRICLDKGGQWIIIDENNLNK